jgi:hypothetical protein
LPKGFDLQAGLRYTRFVWLAYGSSTETEIRDLKFHKPKFEIAKIEVRKSKLENQNLKNARLGSASTL